jgi:plasmid stabilization system protein ParE
MANVIVRPRARHQLRRALEWWVRNRDKAPTALEDDFAETRNLIGENPNIGQSFRGRKPGTRRILMKRVRYYIFYRIDENGDVEIVSVWHASRRPPKL